MANKKISQMDPVVTLEEQDNLYFNASSLSRREVVSDIRYIMNLANINVQSNTNYTIGLHDEGCIVERSNSTVSNTYIPSDDEANVRYYSTLTIVQTGTANTSIVANNSVSILIPDGHSAVSAERYAMLFLYKRAANSWLLSGFLGSN